MNRFCELFHTRLTDNVGVVLLAVRSCQFQLGSVTNQLTVFFTQLGFQILPIVAVFAQNQGSKLYKYTLFGFWGLFQKFPDTDFQREKGASGYHD